MTLKQSLVNTHKKRQEKKDPSKCQSFFHKSVFYLTQKQRQIPVPRDPGPRGTPQKETQLSSLKEQEKKKTTKPEKEEKGT